MDLIDRLRLQARECDTLRMEGVLPDDVNDSLDDTASLLVEAANRLEFVQQQARAALDDARQVSATLGRAQARLSGRSDLTRVDL